MKFRNAAIEDVDAMMALVTEAVANFRADGIDQWQKGYPNAQVLTEDAVRQSIYVLEEQGEIIGMLNLQQEPEPSYDVIDGAWINDLPYTSFHRVCVSAAHKGRGYAGQLFQEAEALSRALGFATVRIDTHPDNRAMQRALVKNGYQLCGNIILVDCSEAGDPRLAYQKIL